MYNSGMESESGLRVIICGDRHWKNRDIVFQFVRKLPSNSLVIAGGATGADSLAAEAAQYFGLRCQVFPADWNQYGRLAGPIRNRQMLNEGNANLVVAFHADLANSKGTKDMVRAAQQKGVKVMLYDGIRFAELSPASVDPVS